MKLGAVILEGPQNWQILQQRDGAAQLHLAGKWNPPEGAAGDGNVYARVVREDSGDCVIPWTKCVASAGNHWEVVLTGIPAGGLYRVETCLQMGEPVAMEWGVRGDMIHHLGVGELFVIAGQSNSAGYGKDPAYDPPELGVHILRNSGRWDLASHPLNESTNTIHEINLEPANPGSSPWLSFAKTLKREIGCPVGLLQTALGGSLLERWNPEEEGSLYRNMLKVIASQGGCVRGILWYQGCNDAQERKVGDYLQRFSAMVRHLREDTGLPELPFFTVQIDRYTREPIPAGDDAWSAVREAQRLAARTIPNVWIVPSIDSILSDAIHLSSVSNLTIGARAAKLALEKLYGKQYHGMAPDLRCAVFRGSRELVLYFDNVTSRIYDYNVNPERLPFTVEDETGSIPISGAEFHGNSAVLQLGREVFGSCFVSCAAGQNPQGIVPVDYEGHLPILPFYRVHVSSEKS
jgi:sialate O-acetylesterase